MFVQMMQPLPSIPGPVRSTRWLLPSFLFAGFGADAELLRVGAISYFTVNLKRPMNQPELFDKFVTTISGILI